MDREQNTNQLHPQPNLNQLSPQLHLLNLSHASIEMMRPMNSLAMYCMVHLGNVEKKCSRLILLLNPCLIGIRIGVFLVMVFV